MMAFQKELYIFLFLIASLVGLGNGVRISNDDRYQLAWEVHPSNNSIIFSALAPTTGFVGLGLSPGGGMTGADIFVGGVRNGVPYLEDRHATGQSQPILDGEQNLELIEAWENATHTFIKFSRLLDTCDDQDVHITADTINIIWSYGATDTLSYHGSNRGSRVVNLLDPQGPSNPDMSEFQVWELRTNKSMPKHDTTYWCTIHRSPKVLRKHHIIAFDAILESEAAFTHTHHMEAYLCHVPPGMEETFESYVGGPGDDCYYPEDPNFPGHFCESIAYGWAIGGEIVVFPENLGFPLVSGEYFKLEVHYNNPDEVEGVSFDTGLKLYYTDELRLFDAGRIAVGSEINFTQMIPPNSEKFVTVAHCDVSCTSTLPENGVALFNFLIHAHLSGRKLKVRHFRDGSELPWLINDENYDFNFQATRPFRKEQRLFPGDHLTLECEYDSRDKNGDVTLGGRSTREEMCMTFLSYYPRIDGLISCNSEVVKENMLDFFGIQEISLPRPSDTNPVVELPLPMRGRRFSDVVEAVNWTAEVRETYQLYTRFFPHTGYCRPTGKVMEVGYPTREYDYVPEPTCVERNNS